MLNDFSLYGGIVVVFNYLLMEYFILYSTVLTFDLRFRC